MARSKAVRILVLAAVAALLLCLAGSVAGRLLVVDRPQRSDVIVILDGGMGDVRSSYALDLMRRGYGQELILDTPDMVIYGHPLPEIARAYLESALPDRASHVHVCIFRGDSTLIELRQVDRCLHAVAPHAATAMIVTSNFHTRRAFSIARRALPEYQWSVAAAPDEETFGVAWWQRREWAKTMVSEWQRLVWWFAVDQWTVRR